MRRPIERQRRRPAIAVAAAAAYAAAWVVPAWGAPGRLAVAVGLASAAGARIGGVIVARRGPRSRPVGLPVRVGLCWRPRWSPEILDHRSAAPAATLRTRTFTDRLTGLRNYDYFSEAMRSELARVRRYGGCMTLVMLDLDRFKAYNDRHGHGAGNRLLASVGHVLAREKRDADIAARFGGEEFARARPRAAAPRRRRRRAGAAGDRRHPRRPPSTATTCPTSSRRRPASPPSRVDARDAEELFEKADRALYEAKRRGRDRVVTAPSTSATPAAGCAG